MSRDHAGQEVEVRSAVIPRHKFDPAFQFKPAVAESIYRVLGYVAKQAPFVTWAGGDPLTLEDLPQPHAFTGMRRSEQELIRSLMSNVLQQREHSFIWKVFSVARNLRRAKRSPRNARHPACSFRNWMHETKEEDRIGRQQQEVTARLKGQLYPSPLGGDDEPEEKSPCEGQYHREGQYPSESPRWRPYERRDQRGGYGPYERRHQPGHFGRDAGERPREGYGASRARGQHFGGDAGERQRGYDLGRARGQHLGGDVGEREWYDAGRHPRHFGEDAGPRPRDRRFEDHQYPPQHSDRGRARAEDSVGPPGRDFGRERPPHVPWFPVDEGLSRREMDEPYYEDRDVHEQQRRADSPPQFPYSHSRRDTPAPRGRVMPSRSYLNAAVHDPRARSPAHAPRVAGRPDGHHYRQFSRRGRGHAAGASGRSTYANFGQQ